MGTMTPLPAGYRTVEVPQSRHRDLLVLDTWAFPSTVTEDQLEALPLSAVSYTHLTLPTNREV